MNFQEEVKNNFKFTLIHKDKHTAARAGILSTPHGDIKTPIFMPVATHGAIKALAPNVLEQMQVPIILSNTYHLHLSPGTQLIKKAGGLHKFMGHKKAILTDSGGFQIFSLHANSITEEGALFKDKNGKKFIFSPETSIEAQQNLGSDIMMALDECIPYPATEQFTRNSMERTHLWLKRSHGAWTHPHQALFGIIQGSTYLHLRKKCVENVCDYDFPGYAIGGVSVGEGHPLIKEIIEYTAPLMPIEKPRYVMGVGNPEDLLMIWENGIDMSDCIIPTKFARGGTLFTYRGKIRIKHRNYRGDLYPIEPNLKAYPDVTFTRAYMKHLFDSNEILGPILATQHNIAFYKDLADRARVAILDDRFREFKQNFLNNYSAN